MVRGKTVPVRALTDNLDHKITSFNIFTPSNHERVTPKTDQANSALRNATNTPTTINPHLNEIQQHIIDAIKKSEGSCKFEDIFQFVSQKWSGKQKNTSSECRKSIQQVLNSMVCLFRKDHNTKEWTLCTTFNPNTQSGMDSTDQMFLSENDEQSLKDLENPKDAKLTDLQQLIAQTILDHKGACHFDILHHKVLENWKGLRGKDGQPKFTDCKRAILSSLSENTQSLFKRANSTKYWWQLGEYNPYFTKELDREATQIEMIDEPIFKHHHEKSDLLPQKSPKDHDLRLTDLQIFVIEAIAESGGTATIDQITDRVSKNWGKLRRRDGSKYTTDCRRAVQASLANNSSAKPIFRRESRIRGIWGLGKRALEYLESTNKSISSVKTSQTTSDNDEDHQISSNNEPSPRSSPSPKSSPSSSLSSERKEFQYPEPDPELDGVELSESELEISRIPLQAILASHPNHPHISIPNPNEISSSDGQSKSPPLRSDSGDDENLDGSALSSDQSPVRRSFLTHSIHEHRSSSDSIPTGLKSRSISSPCDSTSTDDSSLDSSPRTGLSHKLSLQSTNNDSKFNLNDSKHSKVDETLDSKMKISGSSVNCKSESSECEDSDGQSILDDIFGDLSSLEENSANEDSSRSSGGSECSMDRSRDAQMSSSDDHQSEEPHFDEDDDEDDSSDADDSQDDEFFDQDSEDSSLDEPHSPHDDASSVRMSNKSSHHHRKPNRHLRGRKSKSTSRDLSSSDDDHSQNSSHDDEDESMGEQDPHDDDPDNLISCSSSGDENSSSSEESVQPSPVPPPKRRGRKKKSELAAAKETPRPDQSVNLRHLIHGGPNSPSLIQTLIKDSIVNNNGSCSLNLIIKEVLTGISELPSDQKKALQNGYGSLSDLVESTLSSKVSSAQFFRQDARNPDIWMLSRRGSRAWPIDSGDTLTDLQAEIVQIMALNGGKASWDTIVNEIAMLNFRGAGKARKIIKASLNANINDRPIFKRDKFDNWMVADKKIQDRVLKKYDGLLRKRNFPEETEVQPRKRR